MKKLILLVALSLSFTLHLHAQGLEAFKKQIQVEIVKGMQIANNGNNPIVYGEQGGQGGSYKGQLDAVYWQKTADYTFRLKPGKSASRAVESIFPQKKSMKEVRLECHSMMVAIIFRSIMLALGPERFDQIFGAENSSNQRLVIKSGDNRASGLEPLFLKGQVPREKMEIGDWVYFLNTDQYLHKHPDGPWQGENGIFVGMKGPERIYSGFGAANLTEKQMLKELMDAYNEPQTPADKEILAREWQKMMSWLGPNTVFRKQNYFQLSPKLFKKIPRGVDAEEILDELFVPVAKGLGYRSVEIFSSEFEYGVDDFNGGHIFWIEKIRPYRPSITIKEVPGLARIDRLDYKKIFSLK